MFASVPIMVPGSFGLKCSVPQVRFENHPRDSDDHSWSEAFKGQAQDSCPHVSDVWPIDLALWPPGAGGRLEATAGWPVRERRHPSHPGISDCENFKAKNQHLSRKPHTPETKIFKNQGLKHKGIKARQEETVLKNLAGLILTCQDGCL